MYNKLTVEDVDVKGKKVLVPVSYTHLRISSGNG